MFDPWRFEKFSGNGGSGARGLRRTLSGSGLKEAYRLGRELPQNSNDAARSFAGLVRMSFRLRRVGGPARRALVDLLQASALQQRGILSALPDPLPLLYVEDHGTLGLGGIERADTATDPGVRNRYVGLCLTFGDAAKDAQGGGTFGFGKSVLWNASRSRIVLFHSRFDREPRAGGITTRLIGCALFDTHTHGSQRYTGRAFLGRKHPEDEYTGPLTGAEADRAAARLAFTRRVADDTGTSILIVDSHFDSREHLEAIREGIERYYWPRIVDGSLQVRFLLEDEELPAPHPRGNPSLIPYICAYERAAAVSAGREVAQGESAWHGAVLRAGQLLGSLALNRVEPSAHNGRTGDEDEGDGADRLCDTVALIRTPRMVVRYHAPYQRAVDHHFAGVFLADDAINPTLAKSEPPAHNLWDQNADELSAEQNATVRAVLDGIRKNTREFLSRQRAREVEPAQCCAAIDRELADLVRMAGTGQGGGRGGAGSRPGRNGVRDAAPGAPPSSAPRDRQARIFTLTAEPRSATDDAGRQIVEAKVTLQVASAADRRALGGQTARARFIQVTACPRILVDEGQFDDNDLGVASMTSADPDAQVSGNRIIFRLEDGALTREFTVRTVPLEHDEQVIDFKAMGHLLTRLSKPEKTNA